MFLGDLKHSKLFSRAVPLEPSKADGLIYRSFTTADRKPLSLHGAPAWSSSLRSCRPMWDLDQAQDRARADIARHAIREYNDFELLEGG